MAKNTDEYGLLATPFINIEPIKGLIFRSQLGLNARFRLYDEFTPTFDIDNLERAETSVAKMGNEELDRLELDKYVDMDKVVQSET